MNLNEFEDKKILILGFGREGIDSFKFLRRLFPDKIFGIGDRVEIKNLKPKIKNLIKKDKKIKLHLGKNYLESLKKYDIIIKSPGISLKIIKSFITRKQRITSQTEIFFENFKGIIVGVTGTKGKGTTCSLIYQILKKGGLKVHLVGNIGKPVLSYLLKDSEIFIYELSSHQLQNLKKSPHIAVFLNLFPDHLDYYKNFNAYQRAKENITTHQTKKDFLIYNADDKIVRELAKKSKAQKIPFSSCLRWKLKHIKIPLKGDFNLLNVMAAVEVAKLFNVPIEKIKKAIKSFQPLPHRLEFVGRYKGVAFYNDSMSTIPEVTMAALDALGQKVKTLIVGGSDKGSDYSELARKILKNKIRTLIVFPAGRGRRRGAFAQRNAPSESSPRSGNSRPGTGEKIWQNILALKKRNLPQSFFVNSMKEAVKVAYQQTQREEICLLSPAAASFNLFRDYKERGGLFKKYIKQYGYK